jgi:hypothetical protein
MEVIKSLTDTISLYRTWTIIIAISQTIVSRTGIKITAFILTLSLLPAITPTMRIASETSPIKIRLEDILEAFLTNREELSQKLVTNKV